MKSPVKMEPVVGASNFDSSDEDDHEFDESPFMISW